MPITPTNITKNASNYNNQSRGASYLWGDVVYTWGDAVATWGYAQVLTNNDKTPIGSQTTVGSPIGLLLALTHAATTAIGGWLNINKS